MKLQSIIKVPMVHLDQLYWKENWRKPSDEAWHSALTNAVRTEQWILDGNYSSTLEMRLEKADTVFYLDYATLLCFGRVVKRTLRNYRKERIDMAMGCPERWDLDFLHYVLTYRMTRRNKMLAKLDAFNTFDRKIHIFRNDQEATMFLKNLSS